MENLKNFLMLRPAIRLQYDSEGSFSEYARKFRLRMPVSNGQRLTGIILEYVDLHYSNIVDTKLLRNQLSKYPMVSSADHAGIISNKILLNSNMLLHGIIDSQSLPYQIVFSSNRIPFSNASNPRGFSFGNNVFYFFPRSVEKMPVFCFQGGIKISNPHKLQDFIVNINKLPLANECAFLNCVFFDYLNMRELCRPDQVFFEQLQSINCQLWPLFFKQEIRQSIPKFVTLPLEEIVVKLCFVDLRDRESWLFRILFESQVREIYLQEFNGVQGCWSDTKGTHFFWGISKKLKVLPLRVSHDHNYLVPFSPNEDYKPIRLLPDSIIEALEHKIIVPSLFIEMFLIAFVEGFTLFGGFNQVTYLAWMRVAHERAMLRMGEWAEAAKYARTPTDGLICGPIAFPQWNSSFDMMWDFNSTNGKFNGNLDRGLTYDDIDTMMDTPFKDLIKNGIDDMLEVIE